MFLAGLDLVQPGHAHLLSEPEAERAAQFRQQADRDRFTLATALLRRAVSGHTGIPARLVTVDRSCEHCGQLHGRPRLPDNGLEASISHSGALVAVALTPGLPVGVDIELIGLHDWQSLVATVCELSERQFARSVHDFFAYWTRKEAVLKATGEGLRTPMTRLTVSPPGSAPALVSIAGPAVPACRMAQLPVPPGYAGAVAVLTASQVAFKSLDGSRLLTACGNAETFDEC